MPWCLFPRCHNFFSSTVTTTRNSLWILFDTKCDLYRLRGQLLLPFPFTYSHHHLKNFVVLLTQPLLTVTDELLQVFDVTYETICFTKSYYGKYNVCQSNKLHVTYRVISPENDIKQWKYRSWRTATRFTKFTRLFLVSLHVFLRL